MFDNYELYNQGIFLQQFLGKLKNNELTLENILEEDEIVNDIKYNTESEFINFITDEKIKKLIDYSTKMPKSDEHNIGFKYPFNATEILSSENIKFQNKFFVQKPFITKESKELQIKNFKEKLSKAKKIKKDGFIFNFFKILNKVKNNDKNEDKIDLALEKINEEDFSEEEILEHENSKNIEQKMVYENIDYLLNFLLDKEGAQENYVLIGYFYKILNTIINIHGVKIVQYLYDFPKKDEFDILNILVNHMNRKSMCDIIRKLLTFEDDLMDKYEEKKIGLFEKILDKLNSCDDNDKYDCICDCLYLTMNNSKFFDSFMKRDYLLKKVYNIFFDCKKNNNNKKSISIFKLLVKINENILQRFEVHFTENPINNNIEMNEFLYGTSFPKENDVSSKSENQEILKNFLNCLFEILENNQFNFIDININEEEFTTTYMKKQKKIGLLKIKQTEYISSLIEIFVNSFGSKYHENKIDILINNMNKKGIFWSLHDMFFSYIFSNIYQMLYKRIMEIVLNEHSPKNLTKAFFFEEVNKKRNIIDLYIEKEISNEMKFNNSLTNTYTFNPCFAFINSILYQIYTSQNNEIRKILEENNDIHIFVEIMVEEFENFFQYKLLYQDPLDAFCSNTTEANEPSPFCNKSIYEIFEENCMIYNKYKNGEDYKILLKEKKERIEKEKEKEDVNEKNKESENDNDKQGIKYIDDIDDELEENPSLKENKLDLKKDRDNFLEMLNKPTSEINKEKDNDENDNENVEYHGRFKIDDLDDEVENDNKINDDNAPDLNENKIYSEDYNKINDNNSDNNKDNEIKINSQDEKIEIETKK